MAHRDEYRMPRRNQKNGKYMQQVHVPVAKVTSYVYGGEHLDELYVTTNTDGTYRAIVTRAAESRRAFSGEDRY